VANSKRHGSNAYFNKERQENFLIEQIDRKEAAGKYNEENTQPVRTDKDGNRIWQY
jgi:hypothetical protein